MGWPVLKRRAQPPLHASPKSHRNQYRSNAAAGARGGGRAHAGRGGRARLRDAGLPKPPKATTNAPKAARGLDQPAKPLPPPPLTTNASSEAPTPSPAPPSKPTSKDEEWSPGAAIDSGNASAASPSLSRNGSRGSATDPSPPSPSGTQSLEWESQASLSPTRSIGPSRRRVESVGSALRQGGRPEQQDRVLVEKAPGVGLIVGVFDGHGGAEAAELASKDLWPRARQRGAGSVERARESLRGAFDDLQTDIDEAHTAAAERHPKSAVDGGHDGRALHCEDVGDLIDVAHVGDSRAVVGRDRWGRRQRRRRADAAAARARLSGRQPDDGPQVS